MRLIIVRRGILRRRFMSKTGLRQADDGDCFIAPDTRKVEVDAIFCIISKRSLLRGAKYEFLTAIDERAYQSKYYVVF